MDIDIRLGRASRAAHTFHARQGFTQVGVLKFQIGANAYDDRVLALAL